MTIFDVKLDHQSRSNSKLLRLFKSIIKPDGKTVKLLLSVSTWIPHLVVLQPDDVCIFLPRLLNFSDQLKIKAMSLIFFAIGNEVTEHIIVESKELYKCILTSWLQIISVIMITRLVRLLKAICSKDKFS